MLSTKFRIVATYFLLGLFLWFADAFLDYMVYYDGPFLDLITKDPPARKLFTRTVILCAFFMFGIISAALHSQKKETEQALREANARYRILLNNAYDSVFMHEISNANENWTITEANNAACERFGYVHDDLLRMSATNIFDPDGTGEYQKKLREIFEQKQLIFDSIYGTADGRRMPVEISARLFRYHGRRMVLAVARELGQRKPA